MPGRSPTPESSRPERAAPARSKTEAEFQKKIALEGTIKGRDGCVKPLETFAEGLAKRCCSLKVTKDEAVGFCVVMAGETGSSAVVDRVISLVVGEEPLESPSPGALVEVGVLDHDVDPAAVAFKDDSALLLRLDRKSVV